MRKTLQAVLGIILPALAILGFLVLLALSLTRLATIERNMRIEAGQNMLWVISRAHISSLQLGDAMSQHLAGSADKDSLDLRHDVFLSRLDLLQDGPQRRMAEALGFADAIDRLQGALPDLAAMMVAPEPQDLPRLRALLAPYDQALTAAANKAMIAEWDALGSTLDATGEGLWQVIGALIGILVAGGVICGYFLLGLRETRRRKHLLDKEKAFSEMLVSSSGEGIIAVNTGGACTLWNRAAAQMFQSRIRPENGQPPEDLPLFFRCPPVSSMMEKAIAGQASVLFDHPFQPADDSMARLDLRCFPLRDGTEIIGAIMLVLDVTERWQAQKEIADHRDHLEELVEARTSQLDAALHRERQATALYRDFGMMISHQFRTPLAIVDSALQRLMRRSDRLTPQEVMERGASARQAIARLTRLVETTLDVARIDANHIEVNNSSCDIVLIIRQVCADQSAQTPERRIILDLPATAPACCDPVHVENILGNMVTNAVQYSPEGSHVVVTLANHGNGLACTVTNTGTLYGAEERRMLFQRYFRGKNAEGRTGTGVGLYMARVLARLQGGDLVLQDSAPGTVSLSLQLPQALSLKAEGRI